MLADEVTHVKMGSDWLRRLTDKDPERRERALEFQRTVDSIFNLGGFRGEDEENPIQLARRFRELAGFTDEENDSLAELGPRVDRAGPGDGRDGDRRARRESAQGGRLVVSRVTVTPDPFTLIAYDAAEIAAIVEDVAALVGLPPAASRSTSTSTRSCSRRSRAHVRRRRRPRRALDLGRELRGQPPAADVRARAGPPRPHDRAAAGQGPALARLRRRAARRPAHPRRAGCVGRVRRRPGRTPRLGGLPVRHQAQLYEFRLQHGFTDVADAAFERLLGRAVDDVRRPSGRSASRPAPPTGARRKVPVDLLRQK